MAVGRQVLVVALVPTGLVVVVHKGATGERTKVGQRKQKEERERKPQREA